MWRIVIALLLLVHGLISGAQSFGRFGSTASVGLANPSWLSWWPTKMGQSWLLPTLGMENRVVFGFIGLLWLVAMICFVAAGLGLLGIVVPRDWWRGLAITGAVVELLVLVLFFHPLYLPVTFINAGIIVALYWADFPSEVAFGA
jgi:hypothetical protein